MPDEVDVNAGAARVDKILHPDGGNQMSLEQQEARAEMKEAGIPTRKTRSDAGKPRETFYVSIPGIRFDLAEEVGREAFKRWFGAAILEQGNMLVYCLKALDELFAHLDRLRK